MLTMAQQIVRLDLSQVSTLKNLKVKKSVQTIYMKSLEVFPLQMRHRH